MITRFWYKVLANLYGLFGCPRRLTYATAMDDIKTPFRAHAYLEKWARYRANEAPEYNCILPELIWSDTMLNDQGKHLWDCDDYSNAMIDPLNKHGHDCCNLLAFTDKSGHATLLIDGDTTLGTFGLWPRKTTNLKDIAQSFYPNERIRYVYLADREWRVLGYGELSSTGVWAFVEVDD